MAASKRKKSSIDPSEAVANGNAPSAKRRGSSRILRGTTAVAAVVNPDLNADVVDAPSAMCASPDSEANGHFTTSAHVKAESNLEDGGNLVPSKKVAQRGRKPKNSVVALVGNDSAVPTSKSAIEITAKRNQGTATGRASDIPTTTTPTKMAMRNDENDAMDPEADGDEEADEEEVKEALSRPPPVNSDYLPLPWRGRLGYACLNTYLRSSNPPVFSSRTCRIQSILEHRHPLQDPSQPEHPIKNRPDRSKPASVELGQKYVEALCLANVKDIAKMIKWNDRYNIKFLRLSSEMFPFASHPEYGYTLAPFATEALAEAGRVIAQYGHRVTTHPGQFTQLGSPRKEVIQNAIRDLEYHNELLTLLKLPEQQNKDAVMILHMGGIFEGKQETLQRFRENYKNISQAVKNRLVLENDDMGWRVHDLLPVCEELNIPMVLDFHHHNIVFDNTQIREGTKDIIDLFPRIKATWDRKGIRQKMHYSEPTPPAITPRQRRKHNPRVATLPPCPPDMDLMIEAKDKEQAVFELMRTFKLPGYETFNDIVPYTRSDDNKVVLAAMAKKARSKKKNQEHSESEPVLIPDDDVGMGGPEGRVYWPPGMEEWLRPKKREVKRKDPAEKDVAKVKELPAAYTAREAGKRAKNDVDMGYFSESDLDATPATKKAKAAMRKKAASDAAKAAESAVNAETNGDKASRATKKTPSKKRAPSPGLSSDSSMISELQSEEDRNEPLTPTIKRASTSVRKGMNRSVKKAVSYAVDD